MSNEEKAREDGIFSQELSLDDLDAAAGGHVRTGAGRSCGSNARSTLDFATGGPEDGDTSNCVNHNRRPIYGGGGFPNCAATVEDGSYCSTNDACYKAAILYDGRTDCAKAWR